MRGESKERRHGFSRESSKDLSVIMATDFPNCDSPEIRTKTMERALFPLMNQISQLVSQRSCGVTASRDWRCAARVGQAVSLAVERFAAVGETIADDNADVRQEMYDACKEARAAGGSIERLCAAAAAEADGASERDDLVRAARSLLAAVTRVLLLADIVVVNQLLLAKDKVSRSLSRLEGVASFGQFVRAFAVFGGEMAELARLSGARRAELRAERRAAQLACARQVLERSTIMLLTSSKLCLRHPTCLHARENRDTVFCQMRRAMDLIHYVVKDGVRDCQPREQLCPWDSDDDCGGSQGESSGGTGGRGTAAAALRRVTALAVAGGCEEALSRALDALDERTHDFTDSPYTADADRARIVALAAAARTAARRGAGAARAASALGSALRSAAHAQAAELRPAARRAARAARALVAAARAAAERDPRDPPEPRHVELLRDAAADLREHLDHILEICKLLRHVATTETLQVSAKFAEINLRIYGPQLVSAARAAAAHPGSRAATDNLDVYADTWQWLLADAARLARDALRLALPPPQDDRERERDRDRDRDGERFEGRQDSRLDERDRLEDRLDNRLDERMDDRGGDMRFESRLESRLEGPRRPPDSSGYMSLPRPGKHGSTSKPLKAVRLDSDEQAKIAKSGLEMKMMSSEMDAEADKWQESGSAIDENNDIVKRAKNMSSMAFAMYQFTKGEGRLNTTQDLFTQAEYFAEEANRLYKVVRQFSYQVPAGTSKKDLLAQLDTVPTYVQQLQFTVKESTVGRQATFSKVDNVITETKHLMNVISKVVTTCFHCASKYKLELTETECGVGNGAGGAGGAGGSTRGGNAAAAGATSGGDSTAM